MAKTQVILPDQILIEKKDRRDHDGTVEELRKAMSEFQVLAEAKRQEEVENVYKHLGVQWDRKPEIEKRAEAERKVKQVPALNEKSVFSSTLKQDHAGHKWVLGIVLNDTTMGQRKFYYPVDRREDGTPLSSKEPLKQPSAEKIEKKK